MITRNTVIAVEHHPLILFFCDLPDRFAVDQVGKRNSPKKIFYLLTQALPKIVCQATAMLMTVFLTAALRRINRFVHRKHNVGNYHLTERAGNRVTATRASGTGNKIIASEPRKQLLQIRQ
jgi:hypothetical protein